MGRFSADWLALREPADRLARSSGLAQDVATALAGVRPVRILDLACGTGANTRYLSGSFAAPQDWLLVDNDETLLERARASALVPVSTRVEDLSRLGDAGDLFAGRHLVTASALLDLVSGEWLVQLLSICRDAGAAVLFALSYDGRIECEPRDPFDDRVLELVNQHQRGDKGFGPALGPQSAATAAAILGELGYAVWRSRSDWTLAPDSGDLQSLLIAGWAEAATEMAPPAAEAVAAWQARRLAYVRSGSSHLLVGHEDVAGLLSPGTVLPV